MRQAQRRRRRTWTAALATAAAVVVCGFGGIAVLRSAVEQVDQLGTASAPDAGAGAERASGVAPGAGAPVYGGPTTSSGRDYGRDSVGEITGDRSAATATEDDVPTTKDDNAQLHPLRDPMRLNACLRAIVTEYGGTVTHVDFARFEGRPALVVVLDGARAAAGQRWIVVVGPTCGTNNAITDERYHGVA